MNAGKVLLGIMAGAAAGAAIGILFAPDKGSETRKQISQKGEDLLNNLKNKFEEFLLTVTKEMEVAKSEAEDLLAQGKEKVQQTTNNLKN